ncbi:MAG: TIGR04452 family lipoprotein [Leptospiraceae bacterium]|nr:TIGR04452 family lipoprotein [Leptospiraceae bacterium]
MKLLLTLLFASNCILIDSAGLNPTGESVSGREARDIIVTKAVLGSLIGCRVDCQGFRGFYADKLAFIDLNSYYYKKDIDACANSALLLNLAGKDIGGVTCNLRKHKKFIDWPIPIL